MISLLAAEVTVNAQSIESFLFMGKLVMAGLSLLGGAAAVSSIWANSRRSPPLDKEFATKTELSSLEARIIHQITLVAEERQKSTASLHEKVDHNRTDLLNKIDGLRATMQTGFLDVQRAIGRIEGKLQTGEPQ